MALDLHLAQAPFIAETTLLAAIFAFSISSFLRASQRFHLLHAFLTTAFFTTRTSPEMTISTLLVHLQSA